MPALLAASAQRTAHEEASHGYKHISPVTEPPRAPFSSGMRRPARPKV